jgi:uncharacterized protein YndB with AHSA1/START domain
VVGPRRVHLPRGDPDLRVGGAYRIVMQPPDGELFHLTETYIEVELNHGPFATEARRELHKAVWTDTLVRLGSYVAPA